jgi:hypothetical protein
VPKAALEFFLNPAIPDGMKPPPPPPKTKEERKKLNKGKSIVTSTSQPSTSSLSPTKSRSSLSKPEKKKEKHDKKDKKFSSPSKPKDKKPFPKVNKGRVAKPKNVPLDSLSFTKALHLAGRISRGEIVGTPTLLQNKLVQLALMQFESMKTFTKVKLTAGEEVPMVKLPSLTKPSPTSSTVVKSSSHGEGNMEVEVVASTLPPPDVGKNTVIASAPSNSGISVKAKPIVDDLAEMLNPIQVQSSKLSTIPEEDDPMEKANPSKVAHDDELLDHQDGEEVLPFKEEYTKLLDQTDENEKMDETKNESEDDHFDP